MRVGVATTDAVSELVMAMRPLVRTRVGVAAKKSLVGVGGSVGLALTAPWITTATAAGSLVAVGDGMLSCAMTPPVW